jgi:Cu2+-exporting ATPase
LADVGVTLQDGSELARNVADVVLTRNNISDLGLARSLGKQALRRIHHNYIGIVSINSLLLLLGITGVITPASSALLHNASTILSALNGMRSFKKSVFRQGSCLKM